jgi:hypothetical protein
LRPVLQARLVAAAGHALTLATANGSMDTGFAFLWRVRLAAAQYNQPEV